MQFFKEEHAKNRLATGVWKAATCVTYPQSRWFMREGVRMFQLSKSIVPTISNRMGEGYIFFEATPYE